MERKNERLPIFTERFRELQGDRSNTEFAEFLEISRQTVGFYCNGDRIPDALTLKQIAEKCGVSADWLLGISNYPTIKRRQETNDLFDRLSELMEIEFDEHDRKRVTHVLLNVIDGFKHAMCDYTAYTWYENAIISETLALSTATACLKLIYEHAATRNNSNDKLFKKIDRIMDNASVSAYKELGHFFSLYRKKFLEVLNAHDYREIDYGFTIEFDELKHDIENE